ncbi:MAG: hypothetical protein RI554_11055 [Trueperaceae bacterium]|nr:hypothetical protein [Trueperaceae bacterium]
MAVLVALLLVGCGGSGGTDGGDAPPDDATVRVTRAGDGAGTVTSAPPGLACGATCSAAFEVGATLVLTATPDAGATFAGWTDCPAPDGRTCTLTVAGDATVGATFDALPDTPRPPGDATLALDPVACERPVPVGGTCTVAVRLPNDARPWGGATFTVDATGADRTDVRLAAAAAGCRVDAGATRVAFVCPDARPGDGAWLELDLVRTSADPAGATLTDAALLPFDGGLTPVSGSDVDLDAAP